MSDIPGDGARPTAAHHKGRPQSSAVRINDEITARQVRLVLENGEQAGIVSLQEALAKVDALNLDLVEVAPLADPPVCRIMDYGQFKYQKSKRQHDSKKHQKVTHLKEIKLRPKIETHDLNFKRKHALQFLEAGHKVRLSIIFRGREINHIQPGRDLLDHLIETLKEKGSVESEAKMEGRNLFVILAPLKSKSGEAKPQTA